MMAGMIRLVLAASAFLWLLGCGPEARLAGGATEAGNAIVAGRILDSVGVPAAGVEVHAFREDYDPLADGAKAACPAAETDSAGHYVLRCKEEHTLRLSGRNAGGQRFFVSGVRSVARTRTEVQEASLATPGRLKAWLPDSGTYPGDYVYLPGFHIYAVVDSVSAARGWVEIDSVPAGTLDTVRFRPRDARSSDVLAQGFDLAPGGTASVSPYGLWAQSRSYRLDTAAVPGVAGQDLRGFPLLLRLGAEDIDFSRAAGDGSDLRCSRSDGAPLPLTLASWDPIAKSALAWVRLDSLPAGDTVPALTLHWGKAGGAKPPDLGPVFDTAAGFAGVWFLDEHASGTHTPAVYRDATPGGAHGDDYITTSRRPGHIGYGIHCVQRMWVELRKPPARLLPTGAVTVTAWVRIDAIDDSGSVFAAMEDGWRLGIGTDSLFRFEVHDGAAWVAAKGPKVPIGDGRWRHVAGVRDGSSVRVYVDAAAGLQVPFTGAIKYGDTVPGLVMGNLATADTVRDFSGGLDQVEISGLARSPGWIALEHATRKDSSGVLIRLP